MSKFRQNHTRQNKSNGFLFRMVLITAILIGLLIFGFSAFFNSQNSADLNFQNTSKNRQESVDDNVDFVPSENDAFHIDVDDRHFLPNDNNKSQTIHHSYYSLGYNEGTEQANWVSYVLTKASLKVKNVKRERYFKPDYSVTTRSAYFRDYKNSGYTKGHMAPAGDMAFSKQAMKETFFMSNMSPQLRPFNNGVWKELEEGIRDWAYSKDEVFITTGPVFYDKKFKKIGQNRVGVPDAFYKIIIDKVGDKFESIAFVIPHQKTDLPLSEFATTIDEVEELTNIDFYYRFFDSEDSEKTIENTFDLSKWPINEKRYQQRVNSWNKEK